MSKVLILTSITSLLIAASISAQNYELVPGSKLAKEIKSFCANRWPDNFEMQDYCVEQQFEAVMKLQRQGWLGPDFEEHKRKITYLCMDRWAPKNKNVNYKMFLYCVETQFEAWKRLQSR